MKSSIDTGLGKPSESAEHGYVGNPKPGDLIKGGQSATPRPTMDSWMNSGVTGAKSVVGGQS